MKSMFLKTFRWVKRVTPLLCAVPVIVVLLSDLTVRIVPFMGKVGVIAWISGFAVLGLYAVCGIGRMIRYDGARSKFTLGILGLWIILVCVNIVQPTNISGETTQEIACSLKNLTEVPDAGWNATCLFGYPARQFLVPSLFPLFFGRTIAMLHMGGALYFLLGLSLFTIGCHAWLRRSPVRDIVVSAVLATVLSMYFVNYVVFYFEQSAYPFCFGMMLTGLFLAYLDGKRTFSLILTTVPALALTYSYTPSLAFVVLAVLVYGWLAFDRKTPKHNRWIAAILGISVILSVIAGFFIRHDISLTPRIIPFGEILRDVSEATIHLLLQNQGTPFLSPAVHTLFLMTVFGMLAVSFSGKRILLSVWILGSFYTSMLLIGYTKYGIDFRFHRMGVIMPVFLALLANDCNNLFDKPGWHRFGLGLLFFLVITGLVMQQGLLEGRKTSHQQMFVSWREKQHVSLGPGSSVLIDPSVSTEFLSIKDRLAYVSPETRIVHLDEFCWAGDVPGDKIVFLTGTEPVCNLLIGELKLHPAVLFAAFDPPFLIYGTPDLIRSEVK